MNFKEDFKKMSFKEKLVKLSQISPLGEDRWLEEIDCLYKQITKNWIKDYIDQEYIMLDCFTNEAGYQAMELHLGGEVSVILEPTGTNVAGAFGKADLYIRGHKDEKVFLLLMEDEYDSEKLHWEIWKSKKQKERIPFNKDTFEKLMDEWLEKWAEIE